MERTAGPRGGPYFHKRDKAAAEDVAAVLLCQQAQAHMLTPSLQRAIVRIYGCCKLAARAALFLLTALVFIAPWQAFAASGSITASPNPCSVTTLGGTCTLTLSWSSSGTTAAQVWVTDGTGVQESLFTGTSGSQSLNWIQALPQHYTFQLYAYSGSTKGALLSSVSVSVPSPQLSLSVQPSSSQTFNQGQTMSFTVTVRDPSGAAVSGANVAIQDGLELGSLQNVTTNGSGQATYGYSIPTQVAPGNYTMTFGPATKSGYTQSGSTSVAVTVNAPATVLNLSVTPSGSQTVNPGQSVNYSITVTDSSGNGVSGATVPVSNPLGTNTSVTSGSGGTASYGLTVPSGQTSGSYTVSFGGASKNGYLTSSLAQRTVIVNAAQPLLTLSVSPSTLQTVSAGQTVNYTLTVLDGTGATVSGASVTVTNPFTGTNSTVTTTGGTASYSLTVPSGQGAANYTVFFSGASKSGYTSSSGTQAFITVQPAQGPTAVLSLSAQGNTVGNGGTLTVSTTSGGSVNVNFSATGSTAGAGTIASYAWTSNGTAIGSGQASFSAPFGTASNSIGLTVTNSAGLSSTATATIIVNFTSASTLSLSVQPSSAQTFNQGDTMNFTITVRDQNNSAVSGANVAIQDGLELGSLQNVTTNGSGQATYGYSIPTQVAPGNYTMTFGPATKSGYTQSGSTSVAVTVNAPATVLNLSVTPSGSQTVNPGQSVNYSITVTDSSGNGVSGATVPVANPLGTNTSVTTGSGGTASYGVTVSSSQASGSYTVSFGGASKTGYLTSSLAQRTVIVNGTQPLLTLSVSPSTLQTVSAGQTVNYTLTVLDGTGAAVSGASVTVTNPFTATNSTVTTTGGTASYSLTVPSGQGAANYTVFFTGASKSGYTTSSGTQAFITVQPAQGPTLSLSVQPSSAQTFNQGDTMNFTITVRDQNNGAVSGANVAIQDGLELGSLQNVTTNGSGQATYGYSIPTQVAPGNYTMTFGPATKSGYTQSGSTSVAVTVNAPATVLNVSVTPSGSQTLNPGQSVNYSITVTDGSGNGVSGATVPVANPLGTNTSVTTGSGGTASYSITVSSSQASGSYTVSFGGASKNGYLTSSLVQRTVIVNGTQPLLTLSVSPSTLQTVSAGQTVNYTLTVQDGNGAAVSGASVTVTNPFIATNSTVTTTGGTASYSLTVPSGEGAANYTVFFSGASKSGYTTSSGTQAFITVKPGTVSGSPSGTLTASPSTCQVTTVNGTCAISLVWTLTNSTSGQITVTDALGNNKVVGPVSGSSGTYPISWLQALPQKYVFYLWDYTGGSQGVQLGRVAVSATGPNSTAATPAVGVSPTRNTPGSVFTVNGSGLAPGAATIYVQGPGSSATAVGSATAASDGTFNGFSYTTQTSSPVGAYTVWAVDHSGTKSSTGSFTLYQPTPASIPSCQSNTTTSGCNGDPINTATGNYTYQHTDLTIAGRGMPFAFTRTYNSQSGAAGPLGAGWTHSYMASFVQNSDNSITIATPDGQELIFDPVGSSYISRFNGVYSTLQSPSSGVFVLTTKNQVSYRFSNSQLTAVSDHNGNAIQLTYSNGILTAIVDTAGRRLVVYADPTGRITGILDPAGRSLQYQYDSAGNLVSFTDANGGKFTYTYDGSHQMLTAVDPQNNTFLTNTYDGSGHVVSQADGVGNRWSYAYNSASLLTTITDPNGKVSTHLHDPSFELLVATDTFGKTDQYEYDALGNRIAARDRNGNGSQYSYDGNGNVIAATDALSSVQAAAYDAQNNLLSKTDALGNQTTFAYDAKGNLLTSTDPLGNKATYTYDSYGQLTARTDAQGRTAQYAYDSLGNLIQMIDPLGQKTTYAYDAVGRRTSTTDANNFTTTTAYDGNSNVVSVTDSLGNKTQYIYDGNNNRIKVIDPRGKATGYAYDANYKLITTTDTLGDSVSNTYDKLRNLASVKDQRGNTTIYSYDSESRLIRKADPVGNTTTYAYDAAGNRTVVTDPLGNATTYIYDSLNRLVSTKDALGNAITSAFDVAGRLTKTTDQVGNATTYSYDALGRQSSVVDAAGGVVAFQYDNVGNRVQITDSRGKATQFTYDGMNRLLTTTDPLGDVTTNEFDPAGNLTQTTDGNGNSKSYQYDADQRQIKITYSTGGSIQFTYDANGNLTQMVDLVGTSKYSYDDLDRLQGYTSPSGAALAFTYDAGSNRTALQYPGSKSVQYAYDADNRISKVTDWNSLAVSYSYDAAGRVSGASYSNGLSSQYGYDALGQNLNIQHNSGGAVIYSEATTWSANGNPTSSSISGLSAPGLPSESDAYAYNDGNELAAVNYGSPVSDKNGNLTVQPSFGGATTFTYDLNNRATSISGASASAVMKYFGDGNMAELDSAGTSHRYLIDPTASRNRILAELDTTGAMQIGYVYGPRGLISQISGGQTYTYFHNLQGSTVALEDSAGAVRNSYRYDPFGQKLPSSIEQISNSFAFLGGFSVPSVGQFSLMAFRVYDSQAGRFCGVDTMRWRGSQGVSPFAYSGNAPLGLVDPSGLFALDPLGGFAALNGAVGDIVKGADQATDATGAFLLGGTLTNDVLNSNYSVSNKIQASTFDVIAYAASLFGKTCLAVPTAANCAIYGETKTLDLLGASKEGAQQIDIQKANWLTGLTSVIRHPVDQTADAFYAIQQLYQIYNSSPTSFTGSYLATPNANLSGSGK